MKTHRQMQRLQQYLRREDPKVKQSIEEILQNEFKGFLSLNSKVRSGDYIKESAFVPMFGAKAKAHLDLVINRMG